LTHEGTIDSGPVLIDGSTTLPDAATVDIQFEDGNSVAVPIVWVSAPINAGFFGYDVPQSHWRRGTRPTLLTLRDANGRELRRDSSAFDAPSFRRGPSTGLAPCIVRRGGKDCLGAAFGRRVHMPDGSRARDGVVPASPHPIGRRGR
jgi:hypothetical protein